MGMAISRQCCGSRPSSSENSARQREKGQTKQRLPIADAVELQPSAHKNHHKSPRVIDHLLYPHIIDAILEHRECWLAMASTCRHYHRRLMPPVFRHVVMTLERRRMRVKSRRTRLHTALTPRFLIVDSRQPKSSISPMVHFEGRVNNDVRTLDVVGRRNWFMDKDLCERFQRLAISLPLETIRFVGSHPIECDDSLPPFRAQTYVFLEPRYAFSAYGLLRGTPAQCSKIVTHVALDPKLDTLEGIHAPIWACVLNRVWILSHVSLGSSADSGLAALGQHYSVPERCVNRLGACVSQSLYDALAHFGPPSATSHTDNLPPKRILVNFHILENVISEQEFRDRVRQSLEYAIAMTVAWGGDPAMWIKVSVAEVMKWLVFLTRDEYAAQIGHEQAAAELEVGYDWRSMVGK